MKSRVHNLASVLDIILCRLSCLLTGLADRLHFFRYSIVVAWIGATLSIAAYATLKPSTSAHELPFLPWYVAQLLDIYYDLRTMIMTMGVVAIPAWLLWQPKDRSVRHRMLVGSTVVLVLFECAQIWLPTRHFGLSDLAFTLLGSVCTELIVLAMNRAELRFGSVGRRTKYSPKLREH
ncbi:MAG: hypothetical protein NXI32_20160 [bacterium]|nr:hypothetical protein [bacterium]